MDSCGTDFKGSLINIIKVEPGTETSAIEQPESHFPDVREDLKELSDTSQKSVNIGNQIARWNEFKDLTQVKTNEDAAMILLNRFFAKGMLKEANMEKESSFSNPPEEPETLQMDCETVPEDNLREPENLQMDCETVKEDNLHEDTELNRNNCFQTPVVPRNNGNMSGGNILSIHGLPVNQPFSLKYPSPITGNIVESKIYVIVEQQFVPHLKAAPIKIDLKGQLRKISLQPNHLRDTKTEKKKTSVVDTNHQTQPFESLKTRYDSPQGIPGTVKETESFENVTIKMELDEHEKNEIVSEDILNDSTDKVVRDSTFQQDKGYSDSKRKRKGQATGNVTKKQRLLKLENNKDTELHHSTRSRSRGYRINYADMDNSSGLSDADDLEDTFTDSEESCEKDSGTTDDKIPGNAECEIFNNSMQKKSKVRKKKLKEEDPDFDHRISIMTEADKTSLKNTEHNTENLSSDNYSDTGSNFGDNDCSNTDKQNSDGKKIVQKRLQEGKRIKVSLKDHEDKYYTEEQVSTERQFRGLKEAEKTYKLLVCALCNQFRSSNEVRIETHLEHHLNGDWNCKKCNFEGNALQEYRLHMIENHPSGKTCPVCKKVCGCTKQLHEHLATEHNMLPYVCNRCSTKDSYVMFKERSEYHQHYVENHTDVMSHCTLCDMYFMSKRARRGHACKGKEREMTTCDICGKEMLKSSLRNHKRNVHDNVRSYPCKQCSYAAKTGKELRFHISAKHEGVHHIKCDMCDFTCVRDYQLISHMRRHTGEKPYKCDLCPYSAAWNVQLKEHKQLHGNPIGIECDICGIVVRKGVAYKNHYKKHNLLEWD